MACADRQVMPSTHGHRKSSYYEIAVAMFVDVPVNKREKLIP